VLQILCPDAKAINLYFTQSCSSSQQKAAAGIPNAECGVRNGLNLRSSFDFAQDGVCG
jgi:hypothetical protein